MKWTLNLSEFMDLMKDEPFSYDALEAMFEELTQLEEDIGEDIEFDRIAFRIDYTEYDSIEEFNSAYSYDYESFDELLDDIELDLYIVRAGEGILVRE